MSLDEANAPRDDGNRCVLRGPSGEGDVIRHLRLVYDRDAQSAMPDDFQALLDKLD